uniref:Uncharacterized protein n=1 Tax=Cucumis melo TaxID=3656 RepID=A0A9I9EHR5_CUCME
MVALTLHITIKTHRLVELLLDNPIASPRRQEEEIPSSLSVSQASASTVSQPLRGLKFLLLPCRIRSVSVPPACLPEFPLFSISLPPAASPPSPCRPSTSSPFVPCLRGSPSVSSLSSPSISLFSAVRLLIFLLGVLSQLPTVISNKRLLSSSAGSLILNDYT